MGHQLTYNLLRVRERCKDLEASTKEEGLKCREMELQIVRDHEQDEVVQKQVKVAKEERQTLMAELEELEAGKKLLQERDDENNKHIITQQHIFKMIAAERDETLELLDSAMKQKEQTKKARKREVDKMKADVQELQNKILKEKAHVREHLLTVDDLVARLQCGHNHYTPDAFQELISVRDGMQSLINKAETH